MEPEIPSEDLIFCAVWVVVVDIFQFPAKDLSALRIIECWCSEFTKIAHAVR